MGKYLLEGIKPLADAVSLGISIDTILVREGSSFPLEKVTPEIVLELGAQLFDSCLLYTSKVATEIEKASQGKREQRE